MNVGLIGLGVTPQAIPEAGYLHGGAFSGDRGWILQGRGYTYTSADAGHTWRVTRFGLPSESDAEVLDLTALSRDAALALVRTSDWKRRILFRTADGGITWHAVRTWQTPNP
jgi:photosystem II stability/assembly factor-like uncharacterized protein